MDDEKIKIEIYRYKGSKIMIDIKKDKEK